MTEYVAQSQQNFHTFPGLVFKALSPPFVLSQNFCQAAVWFILWSFPGQDITIVTVGSFFCFFIFLVGTFEELITNHSLR